jgi:hypothetical protein
MIFPAAKGSSEKFTWALGMVVDVPVLGDEMKLAVPKATHHPL